MEPLRQLAAAAIVLFARAITAVRGSWAGEGPSLRQRVYFANHASHGDFILIWTVLPPRLRRKTRPVAAADYWLKSRLRAFIGREVFNAVLIDRGPRREKTRSGRGDGRGARSGRVAHRLSGRHTQRNRPEAAALRSGLYHLAKARPDVELVPVWIHNLNRVMPKGEVIPVPLICKVSFAPPMHVEAAEGKDDFLERARLALLSVGPNPEGARP